MLRRFFVLSVVAAFASAASCAPKLGQPAADQIVIVASTGEHRFTVEIADTDKERALGLMHRTSIADDAGMLFDFTHDISEHSMWMKNTLIPLDIAFIAKDGRIARIAANTTPRSLASIRSGEPVSAVLEVGGGRLTALGVKEGDIVRHPLFGNH